ncbi:MAG: tryptophan synthase subunit alpha [Phycisphaerales bacterium]|jgi:tryptophan synthase alpha chain|nr:tryptophan synthase subunit alpha [Phycisphaerales bacterium]
MNRIDAIFAERRGKRLGTLMPFVCGGFPRPGMTGGAIEACERAGASIVEVGIPFSDPIADGPVIASAMHEALTAGASAASVIDEVAQVRGRVGLGLVAMVSVSIVHRFGGAAGFAERVARAGFDGCIFPDCPLEESEAYRAACAQHGLTASLLIAPTTPPARAEAIAKACTGFVYLLARTGITGERSDAPDVEKRIRQLRGVTDLPLACGFGISSPEHVREVLRHADAAIVGSALVRRMADAARGGGDAIEACAAFTRAMAASLGPQDAVQNA